MVARRGRLMNSRIPGGKSRSVAASSNWRSALASGFRSFWILVPSARMARQYISAVGGFHLAPGSGRELQRGGDGAGRRDRSDRRARAGHRGGVVLPALDVPARGVGTKPLLFELVEIGRAHV